MPESSEVELRLGGLAVAMQHRKAAVLAWMNEEERKGHSVQASQAPEWPDYQRAQKAFSQALEAAVEPIEEAEAI